MQIKWLLIALEDLAQAGEYIAQYNPDAATRVIKRIWKATRILAEQPGMGRPGRVQGTRELVVTGTPYIVPYRVAENTVQILRVMHAGRKWPNTFVE